MHAAVPHSPPADAWQQYALSAVSSAPPPPIWPLAVMRSSQLDAARLDDELTSMLRGQLHAMFQFLAPGANLAWEHELNAVLHLWVYGLTLWKQDSTPGAVLTNLKFMSTSAPRAAQHPPAQVAPVSKRDVNFLAGSPLAPAQKALFGLGYVAGPLLLNALHGALTAPGRSSARTVAATKALRAATSAYKAASLLNMWIFFGSGVYRSLWERLLGIRMAYTQPTMSRLISFEYLNRQLVWHELSEFLLFFLPLIDVRKLRAFVRKLIPRPAGTQPIAAATASDSSSHSAAASAAASATAAAAAGEVVSAATPDTLPFEQAQGGRSAQQCPICGTADILLQYEALPCQHVFCYYCLRAHCEADCSFTCPCDGVKVEAMRLFQPRH